MTTLDRSQPQAAPVDTSAVIRRPVQKRSRDRFEAILDVTERLLEHQDPAAISVHLLAAELGISAASIYHFFPEVPLIFAALAERYIAQIEKRADGIDIESAQTWQDLQTRWFRASMDYFNATPPAAKVLLGSALSHDIRLRDLRSDKEQVERAIAQMDRVFALHALPDLIDRSVEVVVINDALWSMSIHRHGYITEAMEEQARRARIAYARTYLPEYLPRREAGVAQ